VAGIVLAGGRSNRMGTDKALLPWRGSTLLAHVCRMVSEACGSATVVAESSDRFAKAELPPQTRVVADLYPCLGPLGGIVTGLRAAGEGIHVVTACDMPFIRVELLRFLLSEADGWDAAIPEIDGHLQPLCAAYDSRCADTLESRLLAGERSVQSAVSALNLKVILPPPLLAVDPDLVSFTNINTPEQYANLHA
jgi:molybdopterin-guanine dinucleotide biosynthesis protein A